MAAATNSLHRNSTLESFQQVYKPIANRNFGQKILLGMTAVCAILSVIPPLRLGGSLALRSVSLLSVLTRETPLQKQEKILHVIKIGAVAAGIVALAASLPLFMLGSLAADMGVQTAESARALYKKEYSKAFMHISFLAINTLAFSAILLGSWKLMLAAAVVSVVAMISLLVLIAESGRGDLGLTYATLIAVSVVGLIQTASSPPEPVKKITVKNDNPNERVYVSIQGREGKIEVAPGETLTFSDGKNIQSYMVQHRDANTGMSTGSETYEFPTSTPLNPKFFDTLPFGGQTVSAAEAPGSSLIMNKQIQDPIISSL